MVVDSAAGFGAEIRRARQAKGWTQAELAQRLGVNRKWVVSIESGKPTARVGLVVEACVHLDLLINLVDDPNAGLREQVAAVW